MDRNRTKAITSSTTFAVVFSYVAMHPPMDALSVVLVISICVLGIAVNVMNFFPPNPAAVVNATPEGRVMPGGGRSNTRHPRFGYGPD